MLKAEIRTDLKGGIGVIDATSGGEVYAKLRPLSAADSIIAASTNAAAAAAAAHAAAAVAVVVVVIVLVFMLVIMLSMMIIPLSRFVRVVRWQR